MAVSNSLQGLTEPPPDKGQVPSAGRSPSSECRASGVGPPLSFETGLSLTHLHPVTSVACELVLAESVSNYPVYLLNEGNKERLFTAWVGRSETKLSAGSFPDSNSNFFQILRTLEFNL